MTLVCEGGTECPGIHNCPHIYSGLGVTAKCHEVLETACEPLEDFSIELFGGKKFNLVVTSGGDGLTKIAIQHNHRGADHELHFLIPTLGSECKAIFEQAERAGFSAGQAIVYFYLRFVNPNPTAVELNREISRTHGGPLSKGAHQCNLIDRAAHVGWRVTGYNQANEESRYAVRLESGPLSN